MINEHPSYVGLGIDESTALVVEGRRVEIVGKGSVTLMLAGTEQHAPVEHLFAAGKVTDLAVLQREAVSRGGSQVALATETDDNGCKTDKRKLRDKKRRLLRAS